MNLLYKALNLLGTLSAWAMLGGICTWVHEHDYDKETRLGKEITFIPIFIMICVGISINPVYNHTTYYQAHLKHAHIEKIRNAKKEHLHEIHEEKIKKIHSNPIWQIKNKLPKEVASEIDNNNDSDPLSGDHAHVKIEGQLISKPYDMNIMVKGEEYRSPSQSYMSVLDTLNALKKFDLNGFQNVKITLCTSADNQYGKDIGDIPIDWYSFKPSDIKKMNPQSMGYSDLNNLATDHGSKHLSD